MYVWLKEAYFTLGSYANLNLEKKSIQVEEYRTKYTHNGGQDV